MTNNLIEQIKWERNTAIKQPEEHGIEFRGKQTPMTLKEIETLYEDNFNNNNIFGMTVYVEDKNLSSLFICIIDYIHDEEYGWHVEATWNCMAENNYHEKDYNKTWRAWRYKPTKEELDGFPW